MKLKTLFLSSGIEEAKFSIIPDKNIIFYERMYLL